nr:hypothetical protein [Tanacetum cinerariifolium]
MDAVSVLSSGGVQVVSTTVVVSPATVSIPTGSGVVPIASPSIPTVAPIFATATTVTPARIAQSSVLPPVVDEPASPVRNVSQGEACPTDFGFVADQDMANIAKTSTLPHESTSRVTSLAADEGNLQLRF